MVRKSKNAAAANVIHSLDAAHLMRTGIACRAAGIDIMGIHDCYVGLAPPAERLNGIIRQELIRMYDGRDYLTEIRDEAIRIASVEKKRSAMADALSQHPLAKRVAKAVGVAAFLAAEANRGVKIATISRRLAAIRYAHKFAGYEPPTNVEAVKATLRGIRRTAGSAPARKAPATADKVLAMVAAADSGLKSLRDRAILLLGFAGAFRRSELVALNVADLQFCAGGLRVTIRRSKTDQDGFGTTIAIARGSVACPVDAVLAWIKSAAIEDGPLFRPVTRTGRIVPRRLSARAVAELVKSYARRAGFKAANFSGHSLRSGFLTSAAARGASVFKMMDVSRHKSVDTLRGYVRDAEMFRDHAGDGLL
jgi:integrase